MRKMLKLTGLPVLLMAATVFGAATPSLMTYQGQLANAGGTPLTGTYSMVFTVYDDPMLTGGHVIWQETHSSVQVTDGLFTVLLGNGTPPVPLTDAAYAAADRWIGIKVGADPEISPRARLATVAYSKKVETLSGARGGVISGSVTLEPGVKKDADNGPVTISIVPAPGDTTFKISPPDLGFLESDFRVEGELSVKDDAFEPWVRIKNFGAYSFLQMSDSTASNCQLIGDVDGGGRFYLMDSSGTPCVVLGAGIESGGYFDLVPPDNDHGGLQMYSNPNGSAIHMYDTSGIRVIFTAVASGDNVAMFPDNAINANEMLNEPGIAQNINAGTVSLGTAAMADLTTVSLTTPSAGYYRLEGTCYVKLAGVTTANIARIQIDETSAGSATAPYFVNAGSQAFASAGDSTWFPVSVSRVYFKATAGTYTFRMEGIKAFGGLTVAEVYYPTLTATFIPTSYGTVTTLLPESEAAEFPSSPTVTPAGSSTPMREVDLRLLELKVAKERAEADRAERELLEAQLQARMKQEQVIREER